MKKLLVLAILAASMSANATSYKQPNAKANAVAQSNLQNSNKSSNLNNLSNRSNNTNLNNLSNRSNNTNTARAISGDSISKSVNDSTSSASTSNSVNIEAERNTPDLSLSNVQPTIPCAIPINASGVATAFGLGFGTAYIDKACEERELIRLGLASNDSNTNSLANVVLQKRLVEILKPEPKEENTKSNYEAIMEW